MEAIKEDMSIHLMTTLPQLITKVKLRVTKVCHVA